ncbi:MAG: alpha/beta hydrolase [Acidobacteriota bacterium]|nr:alpha/beta hydrolase [Acidobacteriota bacterium]
MNKATSVLSRNNVKTFGQPHGQPMIFAHGYGCDQNMWRMVAPAFQENYRIVLFDHVGFGNSDLSSFDRSKYGTLQGYAHDVLDICRELKLEKVIFVGHSVSAMIGVLAAIEAPDLFDKLILIGPSPRYINDADYVGGFTKADIDGLLDFLDSNYLGWSKAVAPVIMQNPDRPELAEELANSFCRTDPEIGKHFAGVTFLSDNRADLPKLNIPSIILQCDPDSIAPVCVGEYINRHLANSALVKLNATGHCPHLSAPAETISAMRSFLKSFVK